MIKGTSRKVDAGWGKSKYYAKKEQIAELDNKKRKTGTLKEVGALFGYSVGTITVAKLAVLGKLSYVHTTSYHRSVEGNSGTRKKMVKKFGVNRFKNIFFETYSAFEISTHIFNDPAVRVVFNFLQRQLIVTVIFFQINYRLFMKFLRKITWMNKGK